jgi:hypothetical protein
MMRSISARDSELSIPLTSDSVETVGLDSADSEGCIALQVN